MYTQPKLLMYQLILYNILKIFWLTINSKLLNTYIVPVVLYDIIYRKKHKILFENHYENRNGNYEISVKYMYVLHKMMKWSQTWLSDCSNLHYEIITSASVFCFSGTF